MAAVAYSRWRWRRRRIRWRRSRRGWWRRRRSWRRIHINSKCLRRGLAVGAVSNNRNVGCSNRTSRYRQGASQNRDIRDVWRVSGDQKQLARVGHAVDKNQVRGLEQRATRGVILKGNLIERRGQMEPGDGTGTAAIASITASPAVPTMLPKTVKPPF